jgi:hypothetical protein
MKNIWLKDLPNTTRTESFVCSLIKYHYITMFMGHVIDQAITRQHLKAKDIFRNQAIA